MLNKQRREKPLFAKAVKGGERVVQRALRRRRGRLHRRPCLHPAVRLPVAVGQADRRSAARTIRWRRSTTAASAAAIAARWRKRPCSARRSTAPTSSTIPTGWDRVHGEAARRASSASCSAAASRRRLAVGLSASHERHAATARHSTRPGRISIAVLAMGGQGGGVLVDWIVGARPRATAGSRSRPRCPASRSAPARRSITSR